MRGRFTLARAEAVNPLTGERQALLDAARGPLFQAPAVPVTRQQVEEAAGRLSGSLVEMEFLTPTRIVSDGQLCRSPEPVALFGRLFDRLEALDRHYADGTLVERETKLGVLALAQQVRLVAEESRWREAHSYSRRQGRTTPVSGFVGRAVYEAPAESWRELLPLLLWGQSVHVGKSATRGDGWYSVPSLSSGAPGDWR